MSTYTQEELREALRQINSTLHKLRETVKTLEDKSDGKRYKSQLTLAKRRIDAFEIARALIQDQIPPDSANIEDEMLQKAKRLIETRYPTGWGGAAVVHTASGRDYTSVSIETANASAVLCIETGAILEAHKFGERVTHCLCLMRMSENEPFRVLTPCGICQERLRYWGEDVRVAVTSPDPVPRFVPLRELQPYHWTSAYPAGDVERWKEE